MEATSLVNTILWVSIYVFTVGLFLVLTFYFVTKSVRRKAEALDQYELTFLHVKLPPQNEVEVKAAEQFFASLMGIRKSWWKTIWTGQTRISFEIVSKSNGIAFYVVVPDELAALVEKQINGAYPMAEIDIINPNEVWDRGEFTAVAGLKLSGAPYFPILTYEDLKSDAMSGITSAMSKLTEDEVVAVQYIIQPANNNWRLQGNRFVQSIKNRGSNSSKPVNIDTSFVEGVEKKISKPGFNVALRVVAISKDKYTATAHIQSVTSAFEQFTQVKYSSFKLIKPKLPVNFCRDFIYRRISSHDIHIPIFDISLYRNSSLLTTAEMGTIFHFPNKDVQTPNIVWLTARKSAAPTNLPDAGLYLGENEFRGVKKKVYMLGEDRKRHFYIIGQTGTGKSEFMKSMAIQDIINGEGIAFIDPHGSDIDDILQKVPEERINDVILFDAADTQRPMGLNILDVHSEEEKHMSINAFIALLYKLYDPNRQGIMGPLLERAIRNVMLTAMSEEGSTMIDAMMLLINKNYIHNFLPKIKDPLVRRYWIDEVANTSESRKGETMGYFVSKFDRFITDSTMRKILGQPKSSFDFAKIMAEKKIFLVDLSKGKIGEENSNFIGLLLVPKILAAALSRAALLGKEDFPNFYLYVDEFQNFATPDFATILSEARKYKLNLIVAHQFVAQLEDDIKEAVFGNVGTMCTFRVGPDDAEYLEEQYKPVFTQSDLINLPIGNSYMRLLVKGQPTVPFSMKVDWDAISNTKKDPSVADRIREYSRTTYGRDAQEIEKLIDERMGLVEPPPLPGPFGKGARIPF